MTLSKKMKMGKLVSMVLVLVMLVGFCAPLGAIEVSAASANTLETTSGSNTYSLFNSGRTGSGRYYSSSYNYDAASYTNGGYDIYASASRIPTTRIGLSFTIMQEVTERATVTIYAFDVDEGSGERDVMYLVDETDGSETQLRTAAGTNYLSGMDWQWNTTTMYVDASAFEVGHTYHIKLHESVSGWVVYVRTVTIQLATGEPVPVPEASFSGSITDTGLVSTTLNFKPFVDANYTLEYSAAINGDQRGSLLNQSLVATTSGVTKTASFQLESGAPAGIYTVTVNLKDANGNVRYSYSFTASKGAVKAVNYDANGGSNNLPIDNTQYSAGDTATALFNYIPSKAGYTFLGWARSSTATTPEFTEDGNKTFTIGSGDVTLYAVWQEIVLHTHTEGEWIIDSAPTCAAEGSKHTVCTECGEVVSTESIAKLPHTEGEWIIDSNPTCAAEGSKHTVCSVCGEVASTESIAKLPHTEGEWIIDSTPTCAAEGSKHTECTVCGEVASTGSIDKLPHTAEGGWVIDEASTCVEPGKKHTNCAECGETFYTEIPARGHAESGWITDVEVACTVNGKRHTECSVCGAEIRTETIAATGHVTQQTVVNATCTTDGYREVSCVTCREVIEYEVFDAFGHSESEWIIDTPATTISTGIKHTECIHCAMTINSAIIPILALIDVADVETRAGATVDVTVDISNNPGVLGAVLVLNYDPALTLVNASAGGAWSTLDLTKPGIYSGECRFVWDGVFNADANNGTIITLTFEVPADAAVGASYAIELSYESGEIVDAASQSIDIAIDGGSITVDELMGDVNDDGVVDVLDVIALRRYLSSGYNVVINENQADMSGDGIVTVADVILLRQYIVNR